MRLGGSVAAVGHVKGHPWAREVSCGNQLSRMWLADNLQVALAVMGLGGGEKLREKTLPPAA